MNTDIALLKRLFGIDKVESVLKDKETVKERARPVKPKVSRVKLTPEECVTLCNNIKLAYEEGYEKRVFAYTFTDETVDRYGDIIKADGADLRNYRNNPIVLAFHNGRALPVGMSIKTWLDEEKREIKGWVLIYDQRIDPTGFCDVVYNYVASGAMKTGSIGFLPKEGKVKRPSDEEREQAKMPRYGVIYEEWELLEFSLTPVPANPSATMKGCGLFSRDEIGVARENGLFDEETLKEFEALVATIEFPVADERAPEGFEGDIFGFYKETKEIADDEVQRPYPNEHACRHNEPDKYDKFRRSEREHEGKKYSIIFGRVKGKTDWEEQAYRYPKATWAEAQARKHCKEHGGKTFEPASEKAIELHVEEGFKTVLTHLATNLNLLIEKLDASVVSNERLVDTLRLCYRLSPAGDTDGEQTTEPETSLYNEETLDEIADAFKIQDIKL